MGVIAGGTARPAGLVAVDESIGRTTTVAAFLLQPADEARFTSESSGRPPLSRVRADRQCAGVQDCPLAVEEVAEANGGGEAHG
jgi:hypothetical protein